MNIIKFFLRFTLLFVVTTVAFFMASSFLPFSDGFQEASRRVADPSAMVYLLLNQLWLCVAIWFVITRSGWSSFKLAMGAFISLFFIYSFMTQIETWFFGDAFPLLTGKDIFLLAIGNGIPFIIGIPLAIVLFRRKQPMHEGGDAKYPVGSKLLMRLLFIGVAYMMVYFFFGYYVAWQSEELRVFYGGDVALQGFWSQLYTNLSTNPIIFPFQLLRGILFGLFALPLLFMLGNNKWHLLAGIFLVYLTTAVCLMIPNFLFPDAVRWAHFFEMTSSMALFSFIVWTIFIYPFSLETIRKKIG